MMKSPTFLCFILCLFVYLMTSGGRLGTWDADMYFAVTERLVTEGRVDLPEDLLVGHPEWQGRGGRYYAPFDIGQSLANVPFYLIGEGAASVLAALKPGRRAAIEHLVPRGAVAMSNVLWMALAIAAAGGIATALGWGRREQAGAMLAAGLATMAWPYATTGFNQALAALGQAVAFWGAVRWARSRRPADAWLTGAGAAVGLAVRLNTVLALPWLLLILFDKSPFRKAVEVGQASLPAATAQGLENTPDKNFASDRPSSLAGRDACSTSTAKSVFGFLVPVLGALALAALYNWIRFETIFRGGYQGDANTDFSLANLPLHLYLLTISPAKGVLWFAPVVVLAAFGAWRERSQAWALAAAGMALTYLIFFSLMNYGHGGVHSWGPRFFAPLMPLAGVLAVAGWMGLPPRRMPRVLAGALIALSAVIQFLAVSSDQSERVAAMEGAYAAAQLADQSPDYFAASWTQPALSPIVDRAEIFAHKLSRGQGLGLAAEPTAFMRYQYPHVVFLPAEATAEWEAIPSRHKTLVLRYRYCFDFWWCYATAMALWPRWMGVVAAAVVLMISAGWLLLIWRRLREQEPAQLS